MPPLRPGRSVPFGSAPKAASPSRSAGSAAGDLQSLMHQLVFECKVSSALHSAVVTALMYSFRKWHSVVASGAPAALEYRAERAPRATSSGDEASQLEDLAAEHEALQGRVVVAERAQVEMQEMASSLRHREARLAAREAALEAALAPPASPSPSLHKTGSRELAAFRTAREGLRREPAVLQPSRAHAPKHNGLPRRASPSASPKGSGSGGAGAGTEAAEAAARELQAATAAARDWQAAARFALANLQGRTPQPPPPLQTLAAATLVAAAEHAVAARGDEAAERAAQRRAAQQQLTALQAEVAAAAAARDEAEARAIVAESSLRASLGAAESGAAAQAAAAAAAPAEEKAAAVGRAASASAARLAADQARFCSLISKAPSSQPHPTPSLSRSRSRSPSPSRSPSLSRSPSSAPALVPAPAPTCRSRRGGRPRRRRHARWRRRRRSRASAPSSSLCAATRGVLQAGAHLPSRRGLRGSRRPRPPDRRRRLRWARARWGSLGTPSSPSGSWCATKKAGATGGTPKRTR